MKKKIFLSFVLLITISGLAVAWFTQKKEVSLSHCSIQHLGIIMDGNRRWARQHGYKPWIGHKQGVTPVRTTLEFCLKHAIPHVTLYAFSLENFKRPQEELDYLFNLLAKELAAKELQEIFEQGIKVEFIGDSTKFPAQLRDTIHTVEEKTAHGTRLTLHILFCYGGQQEILAAVQRIAHDIATGSLKPDDITADIFEQKLWLTNTPRPDLIIRTGKAKRLSNFLTYQSAYSELCFLDCYWPEITEQDLVSAVTTYEATQRNFGA